MLLSKKKFLRPVLHVELRLPSWCVVSLKGDFASEFTVSSGDACLTRVVYGFWRGDQSSITPATYVLYMRQNRWLLAAKAKYDKRPDTYTVYRRKWQFLNYMWPHLAFGYLLQRSWANCGRNIDFVVEQYLKSLSLADRRDAHRL